MSIKTRGSGIPLRGGSGSGGSITVNDHSGDPISTGVRTIEWQTLDQFGFTVVQDVDDPTKVIVGTAPVFEPEIQWSAAKKTQVRVSKSDINEPDTYLTNGFEGQVVDGSLDDFVYNSTLGRGFGDDARLSVKTYHAGTLVDDVVFTCTANGTQNDGNITVQLSGVEDDGDGSAKKGQIRVTVNGNGVIGSTNSGMARVEVSFLEHKWAERRSISQDIFRDKNPNTPSIDGTTLVAINDEPLNRQLKYLSGIAYYDLDTLFDFTVPDISNHNEDSSKPSDNLAVNSSNFGVSDYTSSPWTPMDLNWDNVSDLDTVQGIDYYEERRVDIANFRHIGSAKAEYIISDSWNTSAIVSSNNLKVCVDTFDNPSTDSVEYFDQENKRLANNYTDLWDSERYVVDGEAVVFNGGLYHGADLPRVLENAEGTLGTLGSLTTSFPNEDVAGSPRQNPNYTGHTRDAVFFRKFLTPDTNSYASVNLNITTNGDLSAQMAAGDLKVYLWKLDSIDVTSPNIVLPPDYSPTNQNASLSGSLWAHAPYNFAAFDDGVAQTAATSGCIANQNGNILNLTTGGVSLLDGVLLRFQLKRGVVLKEVGVTFV